MRFNLEFSIGLIVSVPNDSDDEDDKEEEEEEEDDTEESIDEEYKE